MDDNIHAGARRERRGKIIGQQMPVDFPGRIAEPGPIALRPMIRVNPVAAFNQDATETAAQKTGRPRQHDGLGWRMGGRHEMNQCCRTKLRMVSTM